MDSSVRSTTPGQSCDRQISNGENSSSAKEQNISETNLITGMYKYNSLGFF